MADKPAPINCKEAKQLILDYFEDDAMDQTLLDSALEHIHGQARSMDPNGIVCVPCAQYLAQQQRAWNGQ